MKFILLLRSKVALDTLCINPNHIVGFHPDPATKGSLVHLSNGTKFSVEERPADILLKIAALEKP